MTIVTPRPLLSFAQNAEDVVLWRALGHIGEGCYVDIGANAPDDDSVTKVFYDRGWRGLDVEPVAEFAQRLRAERPRDVVVEAAVSRQDGGEVLLHEVAGTGLSSLRAEHAAASAGQGYSVQAHRVPTRSLRSLVEEHLAGRTVHFCKIDVEGAEDEVLGSVDLEQWRPWVLVVEATKPNSNEPTHEQWEGGVLAARYVFCLFDGLSRYYVAEERAAELQASLSYPACSLDSFIPVAQEKLKQELHTLQQSHHELQQLHHATVRDLAATGPRQQELEAKIGGLRQELLRWRGAAVERWAAAIGVTPSHQDEIARRELEAMRQTLSWRVTAPLRAVRSRQLRPRA